MQRWLPIKTGSNSIINTLTTLRTRISSIGTYDTDVSNACNNVPGFQILLLLYHLLVVQILQQNMPLLMQDATHLKEFQMVVLQI